MVAQINGGPPQTHARRQVESESPRTVPAIEEQEETGDSAMQAGENVDAVAAAAHDGRVQAREPPAMQRDAELAGHGVAGPSRQNQE